MRDLSNFDRAECEELEADIRAMCDKLKFVAPPTEYSLEDAVEMIIREGADVAGVRKETVVFPAFTRIVDEFFYALPTVFSARRLSNFASSLIVLMMLMIIPLALFTNHGMAMNAETRYAHNWDRGRSVSDEDLKLECSKYMCGDKRYEK